MSETAADYPVSVEERYARRASYLSLIISTFLLGVKFWAYKVTGSQAVFSDAMETIINVVAAGLALIVITVSRKPADKDHPYGHGKVEYFSAAFEGGLIAFASVMICVEAVQALINGPKIERIAFGLFVTIGAGVINAILGLFLLRQGKALRSAALEASGHHVLSDFVTSAGVAVGLLLVHLTGIPWLDPLAALIVGCYLGLTGAKLVRRSAGGLLDEEDREIIEHLVKIVGKDRPPGIIQIHHARVMRSGHYHHIDAHAVVPEFWNVVEAHDRTEAFEVQLMKDYPYQGELHLHVDPCRRAYCEVCSMGDCPVRKLPFTGLRPLTVEELTNPEEPLQYLLARSE